MGEQPDGAPDRPDHDDVATGGYERPPAFAPPELRDPPLNELAATGTSSYDPDGRAPEVSWQQPARRRRRPLLIVAAACVATSLIVIGVVLIRAATAGSPHTLSLPVSAADYTRLEVLNGPQVESLFLAGGGDAAFRGIGTDDLSGAIAALYRSNDGTSPSLLFIGFSAKDSPTLGTALHSEPAAEVVQRTIDLPSSIGPQGVNPGAFGGAMRCATVSLGGSLAAVGLWADHDTLGIVLVDTRGVTAKNAASANKRTGALTRAFRAVAEH